MPNSIDACQLPLPAGCACFKTLCYRSLAFDDVIGSNKRTKGGISASVLQWDFISHTFRSDVLNCSVKHYVKNDAG